MILLPLNFAYSLSVIEELWDTASDYIALLSPGAGLIERTYLVLIFFPSFSRRLQIVENRC